MLNTIVRRFVRLQAGRLIPRRRKEETRGIVQADEKFIKLSKKEENDGLGEDEYPEIINPDAKKINHDKSFEQKINIATAINFRQQLKDEMVNLTERPLETYNMLQKQIALNLPEAKKAELEEHKKQKQHFESLDIRNWEGKTWKQIRQETQAFNSERIINEKFDIKKRENVDHMKSLRSGLIAYKVGMTSLFDKWGHLTPLTVLQVDRCQVLAMKNKAYHGYDAIVVGAGQRSLNRVKKPMVGEFLKAMVPPKLDICEFKIDPENALPPGYMLGVRHFTVGQFIDLQSRSKGKGFEGSMQRWKFKGQPASHGVSLTHRSHGSTGGRQDPGRVWKGKKMAGRGGFKPVTVRRLQVYKIDFDRSLIYIKGAVPGAEGATVKLFDCFFHRKDNKGMINYPTFVYEKGKNYASIIQVEPDVNDPTENWEHENAVLPDEEDDDAAGWTEVETKS